MKRGNSDLPRLINCSAGRGSLDAPTQMLLWQRKVNKERILRNATATCVIRAYVAVATQGQ